VLTINFSKDRQGNDADIFNLRTHFENYKNCTFKETSYVNKDTKIEHVLSREGLQAIFQSKEEPDVFFLIVLAHGDNDGKIKTDCEDYYFTTFQIWDALKNNATLRHCTKINFFGVILSFKLQIQHSSHDFIPAV
jgi:hypothetical protein